MEQTMFSPEVQKTTDPVAVVLLKIARFVSIAIIGLLPILFIPGVNIALGYSKFLLCIVALGVAIICYGFAFLRSGTATFSVPAALLGLWGVAGAGVVATLLSGDIADSFVGDVLEPQSAAALILLASIATCMMTIGSHKKSVLRLYSVFAASAVVLGLFHIVRVLFGADALSLGVFNTATSSPIGGWNDIALFFGLVIILTLIALEQLPLSRIGRVLFAVVAVVSLCMLTVINFFVMWVILGLVSLAVLMFGMTRNRFSQTSSLLPQETAGTQGFSALAISALVFFTAVIFIIGGSGIGSAVTKLTNISYVEVRPSVTATLDITRAVYSENIFTGVGPNKFIDAWRVHKDPAINETVFWNTDFRAGSGYVLTSFIETGLLGVIAWLTFFGFLLFTGLRTFFGSYQFDRFWNFILVSSFVSAVYLWFMSILYVPGAVILSLAAACTGVFLGAQAFVRQKQTVTISIYNDRRAGFILVGLVMVMIVGTVSTLYFAGRHYTTIASFNEAVRSITTGVTIETVESKIAQAYESVPNDIFAREIASYQLGRMNTLLTIEEPDVQAQQQFQRAAQNGINAAQLAIASDTTEPKNWALLGRLYAVLAGTQVEGASDRAAEAYAQAQTYDPFNPQYVLLQAQLLAQGGDVDGARTKVGEAIALKRNYTDALLFLSQLEIAAGNTENAIAATEAIITLEPQNPARYYQLGVLLSSQQTYERSAAAFTRAIALDTNYANARYFLALTLLELGNKDAALEQLAVVQELNPENEGVAALIASIKAGEEIVTSEVQTDVVEEGNVETDGNQVTVSSDPDTSLVAPVNVVPEENTASDEAVTEEGLVSDTE